MPVASCARAHLRVVGGGVLKWPGRPAQYCYTSRNSRAGRPCHSRRQPADAPAAQFPRDKASVEPRVDANTRAWEDPEAERGAIPWSRAPAHRPRLGALNLSNGRVIRVCNSCFIHSLALAATTRSRSAIAGRITQIQVTDMPAAPMACSPPPLPVFSVFACAHLIVSLAFFSCCPRGL